MILLSIYDLTQFDFYVLIAGYFTIVIGGIAGALYAAARAAIAFCNWLTRR